MQSVLLFSNVLLILHLKLKISLILESSEFLIKEKSSSTLLFAIFDTVLNIEFYWYIKMIISNVLSRRISHNFKMLSLENSIIPLFSLNFSKWQQKKTLPVYDKFRVFLWVISDHLVMNSYLYKPRFSRQLEWLLHDFHGSPYSKILSCCLLMIRTVKKQTVLICLSLEVSGGS